MTLTIGALKLDLLALQAPISGYTDLAMRVLARDHGAELTFSGLMLAQSILHASFWRQGANRLAPGEAPLGGQLVGRDPELVARAGAVLQEKGYQLVDLNFACPAPKVLARGRGGALLREPDLVLAIIRRARAAVSCPLTVKLRSGYDDSPRAREHFWRISQGALDAGVDALALHGRSVVQRYAGKADWDLIAEARGRFPQACLLGSGDLFTAENALERLRSSGVDGVLLARGAIGNPWIFREFRALAAGEPLPEPPSLPDVGRTLERHFALVRELYTLRKAIGYFRKFCVGYCRRHPQRKNALLALMAAESVAAIQNAVQEFFHDWPEPATTYPVPGRAGK
jgi:nifR3 family TIM-barrel protein